MPEKAGGHREPDTLSPDPLSNPIRALVDAFVDPFYELGEEDPPELEADEEGAPLAGTLFYEDDLVGHGHDGILLAGQAALYGGPPLHATTSRSATLTAELSGQAYEWDLDDVDGERWAARQDPWDGP